MASLLAVTLDAKPEEVEPLVDVNHLSLDLGQAQPERGQDRCHLITQPFGRTARAVHHDDEVIRIADEAPIGLAMAAAPLALRRGCHHLLPLPGEMLIQHQQGDVGQQRRQDAALWGPGEGVAALAVLAQNPGLEKRLHQCQDAFVPDPLPQALHQRAVVNGIEARLDVSLQHPVVLQGAQMVNLSDGVLGAPIGPEPIGARVEPRLENGLRHQLQAGLNEAIRNGRDPQPALLAPGLGIIRSRADTGRYVRALS